MTPDEVERAVAAYLIAGAGSVPEGTAGERNHTTCCPTARAIHHILPHIRVSEARVSVFGISHQWRINHTPRVARFIALVDDEPTRYVSFERALVLWGLAAVSVSPAAPGPDAERAL